MEAVVLKELIKDIKRETDLSKKLDLMTIALEGMVQDSINQDEINIQAVRLAKKHDEEIQKGIDTIFYLTKSLADITESHTRLVNDHINLHEIIQKLLKR